MVEVRARLRMSHLFAGLVAFGFVAIASPVALAAPHILDVPVAFHVKNTNTSALPCPSDGAAYTVRGHLVGPKSAFGPHGRRAVTLFLHGFNVGAYMWRLPGFPKLDVPRALARRGDVSLVIDELGYDRSDHPNGELACLGSQADVTHQIVQKLRSGGYSVARGRPRSFKTVVLAGHDAGAVIADIELYSYDDADALIQLTWAENDYTQDALKAFAALQPTCASGGQQAEQGPPARHDPAGGPLGYVQFLTDAKIRYELRRDNRPAVVNRIMPLINRNPCGEFESVPASIQLNEQRLSQIHVPVLYGYGGKEFLWTQQGLAQERQYFSGSHDVTTVVFHRAGHFPQFSMPSAFQSTVAGWLRSRRLVTRAR